MQSGHQTSDYEVQDLVQATAFHNPLRCRLLIACVRTERTLTQLQAETGTSLSKLHYHVERLIAARLLIVSGSEARAGRAVRYFRAVAERFSVPQAYLPELPGEKWAAELRQALRDERNRVGDLSLLYTPDPEGKMMVRLVRAEEAAPPRSIEIWRRLRLDPQQRAALAQELAALLERYARIQPGEGAKEYLTHAAFAPRD